MPRLGLSDQEDLDFNAYGCSTRCLLRLLSHHQGAVDFPKFIEAYRNGFTENQFGALSDGVLMALCIPVLNSASGFSAIRLMKTVKETLISSKTSGVFIITDLAINGSGTEMFHTQLLLDFDIRGRWITFNPSSDGTDCRSHYTDSELEKFLPHFLVLHRVPSMVGRKLTPLAYLDLPELLVPYTSATPPLAVSSSPRPAVATSP